MNTQLPIPPEERLPMAGGYNFRDLGGIKTRDGRYVKPRKLIRSDDLRSLTADDLAYLAGIPLISIVDFRSEDETKAAPDKVPSTVKASYSYPIISGKLSALAVDFVSSADNNPVEMDMAHVMMQVYRMLVTDEQSVGCYKSFFRLLQHEENLPLLFHCSAGKDRTGMAAALILFALGVDEETIMQSYLLSNRYLGDKYRIYTSLYPELKPLFEVKEEYLQAGFDKIKEVHGSVETYLQEVLKVDLERVRGIYLY